MDLIAISTLSCILDNIVPFLIKLVLSYVFIQNKYDIELQEELNNLKQDMIAISIVDHFAKYAKLQRRSNHVENIIKKNMTQRLKWKLKLQMWLIYSFYALNGMLILWLLYMYKNEPVIILSKNILWPIEDLLSWSCQHENAISLLVWLMITRLGTSACNKLYV
ncbi:hypothetical protein P5V15_007127 [Pogonomyrmex californicus]